MKKRCLALVMATLFIAAVAIAQPFDDAIASAKSLLEQRIAEGYPGISVAVGVDGEIVYAEAFGFADVEAGKALTTETKMRIGSVSKPVTAAGLMVLVEDGKIDLDAPIQSYVPTFPKKEHDFTLRQLGGHLAGIRHYKGVETINKTHYPTVLEGLTIFQDDPLLFEPGTEFKYSSYGWNLISAAMEKPAGTDFLSFMQTAVFDPLDMNDTVADWTNREIPNRTKFYARAVDEPREVPFVDNSYKWAGGGFLSTPSDLVRFGSAHLKAGLLTTESLETLFTSQETSSGEPTNYGIGWRVGQLRRGDGPKAHSHGGSSVGGKASLYVLPEEGVVAAMLANVSNHPDIGRDNISIAGAFAEAVNAEAVAVP